MQIKDVMSKDVHTVRQDQTVEEILDLFLNEHIHGAPVLDGDERLVGVVTQQDLFFATMTRPGSGNPSTRSFGEMKVSEIMTSPAVSAPDGADVRSLCRMMHRLRIHRVPIVRDGKVIGVVSSIDICGALAVGAGFG